MNETQVLVILLQRKYSIRHKTARIFTYQNMQIVEPIFNQAKIDDKVEKC